MWPSFYTPNSYILYWSVLVAAVATMVVYSGRRPKMHARRGRVQQRPLRGSRFYPPYRDEGAPIPVPKN